MKLDKTAKQTADWSNAVEKSKKGAVDKGHVGHQAAKMMKRAKVLENRRDKKIEEKSNLLIDVDNNPDLQMKPLTPSRRNLILAQNLSIFYGKKIIFDNVDFQLFLTQILYLNSKRVKIGGEHMEYLNKVLGIEVAYEDLQERCSAEKKPREEILPSAQMLLLHFIYGGAQELSTSQAAKNLELTPTSISRASKQLEEMGLLHIKKEGVPQFYRFSHPITNQYPAMIELFTRKLDAIQLPEDADERVEEAMEEC